jgi:hypothetical protein
VTILQCCQVGGASHLDPEGLRGMLLLGVLSRQKSEANREELTIASPSGKRIDANHLPHSGVLGRVLWNISCRKSTYRGSIVWGGDDYCYKWLLLVRQSLVVSGFMVLAYAEYTLLKHQI